MTTPTTALEAMSLRTFSDGELAALNNALTGFGHVPEQNIGYKRAVDGSLLKLSGHPWDKESLLTALSFEINRRVDAGTWGQS